MSVGNILAILSRPRRNHKRARRPDRALRYGFYQFDRLEQRALLSTITQTQTLPPTFTNFTNQPLSPPINQFDTQGGVRVLDKVEIIGSSSVTASLSGSISNPTTTNETFSFTASVTNVSTSLSGPGLSVSNSTSTLLSFDSGNVTLGPGDTFTVPTLTDTLNAPPADITLTSPSDLAPFIGTGTVGYTSSGAANSNAVFIGLANLINNVAFTTTGQAPLLTVTYTFHNQPTITTTPAAGTNTQNSVVAVGPGGAAMNDFATLANGNFTGGQTGTLTFTLLDPSNNPVYVDNVPVTGNGSYNTATMGSNPGGFLPNVAGTYHWQVHFESNKLADNSNADSAPGSEPQQAVDATIQISPLTPVNEVNHSEIFTVTVNAFPAGTGTPSFGPLSVAVSGGLTPTVSPATISGNTATWTVTINSDTAGTFTVQATDTETMGGVAVTRQTGDVFASGDGSDSASAVKNYVDALISISPLTAVNEVKNQETFTVTVHAFPAGTGAPSFGPLSVNVSGGLTPTISPATISGNTATWTVTINSNTAGTFTVQASDTVTLGGVAVTRTTGDGFTSGDGSDSPSAVKNYVDALISISPLTPVNAVGTPEVFTVTATAFPAGTGTPSFGTLGVTVSGGLTPTVSPATISADGKTATWSVTINSTTAGTFTVGASDTVTMGGVAVTRATGDGFTSGDGSDSASAVKNYVDALISITPLTATNPLNRPEVFTVTATAFPAGTSPPPPSFGTLNVTVTGPVSITPTVSPATISADGKTATWSVTINSTTAGTYTVQASDMVTMGGVTVTRTTGDGFTSGDGSDSPSATKIYLAPGPLTLATVIFNAATNTALPISGTPPAAQATAGTSVYDTATLGGTNSFFPAPTGSVLYTVTGPLPASIPAGSHWTIVTPTEWQETQTVVVSNNIASVPNSEAEGALTTPGSYAFSAVYTPDATAIANGYAKASSANEPLTVTGQTVGPGTFATIGFWHNKNGQAVINSFNGASTSTMLGNWLATNFPHLFGASNPYTGTSLAGLTNAQVATVYANLWTPSGVVKNTYVQAFAVALGIYADTPGLGFNSTAAKFGFKPVPGGGGSLTFNVGSNGAAFGVPNGTTLTVMQILQIVDSNFNPSTGLFYNGDQTKTSEANNVLDGINSTGDIS
jgi:hypothetical protein